MIDTCTIVDGKFNPDNIENMCFPSIPIKKIAVLSIITLGFYDLIWAYKLWETIRDEFGYKHINIVLRTLFMPITNFSLFEIINYHIRKYGIKGFNPVIYAVMYIFFNLMGNLRMPYLLLTFCSSIYVIILQKKINTVNSTNFPNAKVNEWNFANTMWTIICAVMLFYIFL